MTAVELKSSFHKLIDEITDNEVLNQFYEMLSLTKERKAGALWRSLSISEQQNLIETERESHIESNLISHAEMTAKNSKWL